MPPLTYVVDPWLLLAGDTSALARLILLFYLLTRPVAATGRRQLRPCPVDCAILFSLLNLWLLLAGGISAIARLNLFIFAELLHDYYCLCLD